MRARVLVPMFLAALLLWILAAPAGAQESWTVGEVSGPAGTQRVRPLAVNASGVVVGTARFPGETHDRAFRWEDGEMTQLTMPAGWDQASFAHDISDAGVVVGYVWVEPEGQQAITNAVRWVGGSPLLMPCCFAGDEVPNQYGSSAMGVNELGDVVGTANKRYDEPPPRRATNMPFLWQGGDYIALNPPEDDRIAGSALQVNEAGTVLRLGFYGPDRAALMTPGTKRVLDIRPGDQGLNDAGHVVGAKPFSSETPTARLWDGEGYVELGGNNPSTKSIANAVNNSDWAVGRAGAEWFHPIDSGVALLWRPNAPPVALQALVAPGWTLINATDINDDGFTVGVGRHGENPVGFWTAPAAQAVRLDGQVTDGLGGPVAGVRVRVTFPDGREVPAQDSGVTGADGRYSWTLSRGDYRVTAMPEGRHGIVANPDCTVTGFVCAISMTSSRTVDFQRIADTPGPGPGPGGGGPPAPVADTIGPALSIPAKNKALTASRSGVVRFALGTMAEDVTGSVSLKTAGKVRAAAKKKKVLALGSKSFSAAQGSKPVVAIRLKGNAKRTLLKRKKLKTIATVSLRDASGNATVKTFALTLKAPKRKRAAVRARAASSLSVSR